MCGSLRVIVHSPLNQSLLLNTLSLTWCPAWCAKLSFLIVHVHENGMKIYITILLVMKFHFYIVLAYTVCYHDISGAKQGIGIIGKSIPE